MHCSLDRGIELDGKLVRLLLGVGFEKLSFSAGSSTFENEWSPASLVWLKQDRQAVSSREESEDEVLDQLWF